MYSPLRYAAYILWKKKPIQLTFFVTKRCNAKCPFCFYLQKQSASADKQPEISLQEVKELVPSLGRLLWVAFSGGEVYLREDMVDISEVFYWHSKPSILLYSTNGLMPELIREKTEEILKRCPNSVVTVKLSLDGLYAEHDALRGVPGSFEKVMETHRKLGKLLNKYPNFELGINTVLCAVNQDHIGDVFKFVKGLEYSGTHTLSLVRGKLADESLKEVDMNVYREAIETMEADLKRKLAGRYHFPGARLKSAQDILQRRLIYQTVAQQKRALPCYAGQLNLVLTETGDVYPCELLNQKIGNVKACGYDMRKLLQSAQANSIIREIGESQCYCSHECYFMTNILFNPRMYPALIKEYLQL
ncbi:MAG: radical SAM protein [Actinobacteria bacterium]|nr:radical SAM protein [Actinomycetota bacterium]